MSNHPLRADDAIVVFVDVQEDIVNVGATADPDRLRTAVAALADLTTIFAMPVAVTGVPTTSGVVAPLLAELVARRPEATLHVRTIANAFDDAPFRATLEASGRRTVIIAGVASEVAVALAARAAQRLGYSVIVAVDACSGLDARSESATFTSLSVLGMSLSSVPTIAAELAGDFTTESGRAAMRALQSLIPARGHAHRTEDHDHEHRPD